ncbi:MAG: hypothetical protein ABFR95_10685 [Actinomycetota bacterium]
MRTFIVALVLVLFAAGCGTEDGTGDDEEASSGEPTLQDFIPGAFAYDEEDAEQQFQEQERLAQEAIAKCMADEGFEYIPYVQNQDFGGFSGPDSQEEFVAQYGFGVSTMLLEEQQFSEEDYEEERAKDPNNAIAEALSESEREAYYAALHGPPPEIDHESMTEEEIQEFYESYQPTGCYNSAYEDLYNNEAQMAFQEQFGSALEDMYRGLENDPRLQEMESNWSACMAESGYEFKDENDAHIFLLRRLEEVGAINDLDIDPDGMGYGYGSSEIVPGGPVEAAVNEIASEEIAMAKVSFACYGDREKIWREVYEGAEQRFIQEHLAELEQFKKDNS